MRLGQLARKLALRPVEIIDFLAQHHIQVPNDSNAKLDDQHVALILGEFSVPAANEAPAPDTNKVIIAEPAEEIEIQENIQTTLSESESDKQEPKVEVIKAPKVELAGLKVLGKIELPEPKQKSAPIPEGEQVVSPEDAPKKPRPDSRKAQPRRERFSQPAVNPIALQREREAREAEKRRREELERQKQKRTEYYQKKVKSAPPTKRVRMVEEPVEELSAAELVEAPRTWWGKFLRWLNT